MTDRALSEKGQKGSPRTVILQKSEGELYSPNIFGDLKHEIAAFAWNVNKIHSFQVKL